MLQCGIIRPASSWASLIPMVSKNTPGDGVHAGITCPSTIRLFQTVPSFHTFRILPLHAMALKLLQGRPWSRTPSDSRGSRWHPEDSSHHAFWPVQIIVGAIQPTQCCTNLSTFYSSGALGITCLPHVYRWYPNHQHNCRRTSGTPTSPLHQFAGLRHRHQSHKVHIRRSGVEYTQPLC